MNIKDDRQITTPIPFLKDRTVLYVDGGTGVSNSYIENNVNVLRHRFLAEDYTFLFLPRLVERLSPEVLRYQLPGQKGHIPVDDIYKNIREISTLGDSDGFLYKKDGLTYFRTIPSSGAGSIEAAIDEFISSLSWLPIPSSSEVRFRKRLQKQEPSIPYCSEEAGTGFDIPVPVEEEILDPKTQAIIDAWERIEQEFGITIEDLDVILGYRIKLSRLIITTSNRIFLPDLEGTPEVKLDDLTKALYFFYLRHPKGAAFKELLDYENEIYRIYMSITGRDDIDAIRKSVSGLVAPYSTVRDSCVSRIKKAFRDIVGDRIAKYYYIDGRAGDTRKVSIDRDQVIWEH